MAIKVIRKYNCPDPTMLDGADTLHALYVADEAEFTNYNAIMFPAGFKTSWLAKITAARNVLKDVVVVDEQQEETFQVTAKMKECMEYFQTMKPTIEFAFPGNVAVWNAFGFNDYDFASQSQGRLTQFMEMLFVTSTNYSVQLIAGGWTAPKIAQCGTLSTEMRTEQTEQETAKKDRPVETQERIIILNNCWDDMVYVTNGAKAVFYNNFAKLHQYVLPEGGSDEQHTFTGGVPDGTTVNTLVRTFLPADEIDIFNTGTADWTIALVKLVGDAATVLIVQAGTSVTVTASTLGDVTQNHFLNITNTSGSDGTWKIVV